jgi:prepilin-type N-terminal cleavage/methylation domain-containing protein
MCFAQLKYMKPRFSNQRNHGLTLVEVLMVIAILAVIAAMFLPALAKAKRKSSRIGCINCLKQIGLAYRIWEGDNGDIYPMGISVTNGGSMEMVATGNVTQTFLVMSNELSTPRILHCPEDVAHIETYSFTGLANSNISYFVGVDVINDSNPKMIVSGDANLAVNGVGVSPGIVSLSTNASVEWTKERVGNYHAPGNIGFIDGSVQETTSPRLRIFLQQTGIATNRLAIP